jgi:hypothetical protein
VLLLLAEQKKSDDGGRTSLWAEIYTSKSKTIQLIYLL